MSVIRYQPDNKLPYNHQSTEFLDREGIQVRPYCPKYFNRSKNRVNTQSLQSIQFNRGSVIIPFKAKPSNRRKLISIDKIQSSELQTDRPNASQHSTKKIMFENNYKHLSRPQRMRTLQEYSLQFKEKKIKDCIQLMQGVLEEIQNQKSIRPNIKSKIIFNDETANDRTLIERSSKEGSLSKFQSYVKNICNLKQDNKLIILRKAKTKSVINREAIKSTAILNVNKFETICHDRPKQIQPYDPSSLKKKKEKPYFGNHNGCQVKKLDELECSSIDPVNQSSFISQFGKKSLIKHLEEESSREKSTLQANNNKLIAKLKNHRKLKNVFPDGFF